MCPAAEFLRRLERQWPDFVEIADGPGNVLTAWRRDRNLSTSEALLLDAVWALIKLSAHGGGGVGPLSEKVLDDIFERMATDG